MKSLVPRKRRTVKHGDGSLDMLKKLKEWEKRTNQLKPNLRVYKTMKTVDDYVPPSMGCYG